MNTKVENTVSAEAAISQTEFGTFILKYKNLLIGVSVVVIVAISAVLITKSKQNELVEEYDLRASAFLSTGVEDFKSGKVNAVELTNQANEVLADYMGEGFTAVLILNVGKALAEKNNNDLLVKFIDRYKDSISSFSNLSRFMTTYLLVNAYDDLNEPQKALDNLLPLANLNIMNEKVYFDLGRFYQKLGNAEKANSSLQYVIDNHGESEFAKYAKVYLAK